MIKAKSFILSVLLIWLTGGSALFHTHPFLPGALSSADTQIHYSQHTDISNPITPCPACIWERTPTDSTRLNQFAVFYPEFLVTFGISTAPQLSSFYAHLSPRSPPLFSWSCKKFRKFLPKGQWLSYYILIIWVIWVQCRAIKFPKLIHRLLIRISKIIHTNWYRAAFDMQKN